MLPQTDAVTIDDHHPRATKGSAQRDVMTLRRELWLNTAIYLLP